MKIAVVGHICLDMIPNWQKGGLESLQPGQTLEMEGIKISTGGAVPNTGLALDKLGVPVTLVGKVGKDTIGKIIINFLSNRNERLLDNLVISEKESTSYTIVISPPDTDRIFLHDPGSNDNFTTKDIDYNALKECCIFHFGYPPLMQKLYLNKGKELENMFAKAKNNDLVTSLDLAMPDPNSKSSSVNWVSILKRTLQYVDIFLPSIDELVYMINRKLYKEIFVNKTSKITLEILSKFANQTLDWGAKIIVIKLGNKGIYMQTKQFNSDEDTNLSKLIELKKWSNLKLYSSNYKVDVIGTTGAGDSAVAGFLASILRKHPPEQALLMAAATGACSVEEINATEGVLPIEEIKKRIKSGWEQYKPSVNTNDWQKGEKGVWRSSNK